MPSPVPDWFLSSVQSAAAFLPDAGAPQVNAAWRARGLPVPTVVEATGLRLDVHAAEGRRVVPGLCVPVSGGRVALAASCDALPEAVVLHEVRNLATTIVAVSEVLNRNPSGVATSDRLGDLQLAAGQLAAVLGAGEPRTAARCDLLPAVQAAVRLSREGLGVPVVLDPGLPASGAVALGAGDVLQIVLNLVQNAAAAVRRRAGSDPVVRVRVRAVEGGYAVRVEDRGDGLGDIDPEACFVPGRSDGGSSGLGLAAARGLAVGAGGDLRLEGRAEGGAVAILSLPRMADRPGAENRRRAVRVRPSTRMIAEVSLPGARFGARVADWSAGGMRLRGGGIGVPVGARGRARLLRASGRVHEVEIEVVRTTAKGDPCYRFLPGLPGPPAVWLRQDLSRVGAQA